MGNGMICVTTMKTEVTQGNAATRGKCVTTTTPFLGGGGGGTHHTAVEVVTRNVGPQCSTGPTEIYTHETGGLPMEGLNNVVPPEHIRKARKLWAETVQAVANDGGDAEAFATAWLAAGLQLYARVKGPEAAKALVARVVAIDQPPAGNC